MPQEKTYDEHLVNCPKCEELINGGYFEAHDGYATRMVKCPSCDWAGKEEWRLHKTIEYSENEEN